MPLSRRCFLQKTLSSIAFASLQSPIFATDNKPLIIPPLLSNQQGKPILLTADTTSGNLTHKSTTMLGINGHYPPPTIKLYKNKFAKFHWQNKLNQPLSMRIQGLQVIGELYGGISRILKTGEDWSPVIHINQGSGTAYYHSATLQYSAYQNYRGLVGLCIFEDEAQSLDLPNQYGINDIPLILQDMQINEHGEQLFDNQHPFLGNHLMVNGQENCFIKVPAAVIRLRLVNASLSRSFFLKFADDHPFSLIALDQSYLAKSLSCKNLWLAPGERAEILVDLSETREAVLLGGEKLGVFNKLTNIFNPQVLQSTQIIRLITGGLTSAFPNPINYNFPQEMASLRTKHIAQMRNFHFDTSLATINGKKFDQHRIDVQAKLGSVEHWTITCDEPTTFCLNGAKFIVTKINDQQAPQSLWAWKDTVYFSKQVEILVSFDHSSSGQYPFTFGTSQALLNDRGMMGILVVE